jgi:hypothetical protein
MLLRSLLGKEDFLQAAEMVRACNAFGPFHLQVNKSSESLTEISISAILTLFILSSPIISSSSDQRIHLWDFYQDDVKSPSFSLRDLKVLHPPFLPCHLSESFSWLLGSSILSRIFSYQPVSLLVSLRS